MDGIGLFHFRRVLAHNTFSASRRGASAIRRVNILLIVTCQLTRDIAYTRAKIEVTQLFNVTVLHILIINKQIYKQKS